MSVNVAVLGGGPWGLSLAKAARRAGSSTTLCSRRYRKDDHKGIHTTSDLAELAASRLIIMAVPSHRARKVARALGDHLDGGHYLVHGVRGLSGENLQTISDIVREETPVRRLGALGGPVQADELAEGRPSAMVVASAFGDVSQAVMKALRSEWLHIHPTSDLLGLEWASALVGCLSIGVGYAQSRADVSPGLLAALLSRAVDEATRIATAAGADSNTLYGLGGYGDLLASMLLPQRPEVALGRALAEGASLDEARQRAALRVEAIELVPHIARFANAHKVPSAIFDALSTIVSDEADPEAIARALFMPA